MILEVTWLVEIGALARPVGHPISIPLRHRRALTQAEATDRQASRRSTCQPTVVYPAEVKPYALEDSGSPLPRLVYEARFSPARLVLIVFVMLIAFITCLLAPDFSIADERTFRRHPPSLQFPRFA